MGHKLFAGLLAAGDASHPDPTYSTTVLHSAVTGYLQVIVCSSTAPQSIEDNHRNVYICDKNCIWRYNAIRL